MRACVLDAVPTTCGLLDPGAVLEEVLAIAGFVEELDGFLRAQEVTEEAQLLLPFAVCWLRRESVMLG